MQLVLRGAHSALRILGLCLIVVAFQAHSLAHAQSGDLAALQQRVLELNATGKFQEALVVAEQALAIARRDYGPQSKEAAGAHLSIAIHEQALGRLTAAEERYRQGLTIMKRLVPADDPAVASFESGLGLMLFGLGRYTEAEPHLRRSLHIREQRPGLDGDATGLAVALYMLGSNYTALARLDEAHGLLKRSLAEFERLMPEGSMQIGIVLNNLAHNRQLASDYPEAAQYQLRSLALFQKFAPENWPALGKINNNLGFLLQSSGERQQAAEYYSRAVQQLEKAYPDGHSEIATAAINYGSLLIELGRLDEAEQQLTAGHAARLRWLPADHPEIALSHGELATLWAARADWGRVVSELSAAARIHVARAATQLAERGERAENDVSQNTFTFTKLVKALFRHDPSAIDAAFATAQRAVGSSAAASLAQMAVRSAKGETRLSALVRTRQDLVSAWQVLDRELVQALASPNAQVAATEPLRQRLAAMDAQIGELDRDIAARFPEFSSLANPAPMTIGEVQAALAPDEALVLLVDTPAYGALPEETFTFVVTRQSRAWLRSDLGRTGLSREVATLRCGLDSTSWLADPGACAGLTGAAYGQLDEAAGKPPPFSAQRAYELYRSLLGEAAPLLRDKHLLIVPSGALTTLPFHVLVTEPPASDTLLGIHWLIRRHAITVLPATSSLAALRRTAQPSVASRPMIGFGNPLLDGNQRDPAIGKQHRQLAQLARARDGCAADSAVQPTSRRASLNGMPPRPQSSGLADTEHLRSQTPLPETVDELCAVARSVGFARAELRLGARATEAELKRLSERGELAQFRTVHFATHGTLAGQISGTREPGLILTPPETASAEDDGYLSGSEIAALRLDADWVILSACNTAGGAGESAEALSGLARVFFYAGARALLVSHWEVDSAAAVSLITTAIQAVAQEPGIGRAEALRRAMLTMMQDTSRPVHWVAAAHPSVWAPFVVVGEGGAGR